MADEVGSSNPSILPKQSPVHTQHWTDHPSGDSWHMNWGLWRSEATSSPTTLRWNRPCLPPSAASVWRAAAALPGHDAVHHVQGVCAVPERVCMACGGPKCGSLAPVLCSPRFPGVYVCCRGLTAVVKPAWEAMPLPPSRLALGNPTRLLLHFN